MLFLEYSLIQRNNCSHLIYDNEEKEATKPTERCRNIQTKSPFVHPARKLVELTKENKTKNKTYRNTYLQGKGRKLTAKKKNKRQGGSKKKKPQEQTTPPGGKTPGAPTAA